MEKVPILAQPLPYGYIAMTIWNVIETVNQLNVNGLDHWIWQPSKEPLRCGRRRDIMPYCILIVILVPALATSLHPALLRSLQFHLLVTNSNKWQWNCAEFLSQKIVFFSSFCCDCLFCKKAYNYKNMKGIVWIWFEILFNK